MTTQTPENEMTECPACGNILTCINNESIYCDFCELECKFGEQIPDKTEIIRNLAHKVQYLKRKLNEDEDEETVPKPTYIGRYIIRRVCANCTYFKRTEEEGFKHACKFDDTRKIMTGYCISHAYTDTWENLRDLQMED